MDRQHTNDSAFVEGPTRTIHGLKLRPFTAGSVAQSRALKLSLFTAEQGVDGIEPAELQRQVMAFAWMQSAPLADVLDAISNGTADRAIAMFEFTVPIESMADLMREINRIGFGIQSAAVEVVSKPSVSSDEPTPPGNS